MRDRLFSKMLLCIFAIILVFALLPSDYLAINKDNQYNMSTEAIASFRATLMFPLVSNIIFLFCNLLSKRARTRVHVLVVQVELIRTCVCVCVCIISNSSLELQNISFPVTFAATGTSCAFQFLVTVCIILRFRVKRY